MNDELRIGDAERERAAAELGEAYAQGRLTAEEHGERLDRIWASRTRRDLDPIFADLPSAYEPPVAWPSAPTPRTERRHDAGCWPARSGGRGFRPPLLLVIVLLVGLTVVTHLPWILVGLAFWVVFATRHRRRGWTPR
jgi:hypothetical protein